MTEHTPANRNPGRTPENGKDTRADEAVLEIDWTAVEQESGTDVPTEIRNIIEREGDARKTVLSKYDYQQFSSDELREAVNTNSQVLLPGRGAIPRKYLDPTCGIIPLIKHAMDDLRDTNLVDPVTDDENDLITFCEGVSDIVDGAIHMIESDTDWYPSPEIRRGPTSDDALGNIYIQAIHPDPDALQDAQVDNPTVDLAIIHSMSDLADSSAPNSHYKGIYRHTRYEDSEIRSR